VIKWSLTLVTFLLLSVTALSSGQTPARTKMYALQTWINISCRAKGRFQDREYCGSPVIDQIVADGKSAVPVLISQITDSRWIDQPVFDFWPRIRTGELAHFILQDLFLDDTWTKSPIPPFPQRNCAGPSWTCWAEFRKTHSLTRLQARWSEFWRANQNHVYWDGKSRCFRLTNAKAETGRH
jgi:hypothetical protein